MIPDSAQDTINKWIEDGDTKEQAIRRFEGIMRCKLPEIIRPFIRDINKEEKWKQSYRMELELTLKNQ